MKGRTKCYEVSITYYDSGIPSTLSFSKEVTSLEELKKEFLKRFGNINGAPNKAMLQKELVKTLTYQADSIWKWLSSIKDQTYWILQVDIKRGLKS